MTHHITIPAPTAARRSPADRIRALRKRMKLSQKGFADVIGVSSRNIENWEQGRYYPSPGIMVIVGLMERGVIIDVRETAAAPESLPEIVPEEEKI